MNRPSKRRRRRVSRSHDHDDDDDEEEEEKDQLVASKSLQLQNMPDALIEYAIHQFLEHKDAMNLARTARQFAILIRQEQVCGFIFRVHYTPGRRVTHDEVDAAIESLLRGKNADPDLRVATMFTSLSDAIRLRQQRRLRSIAAAAEWHQQLSEFAVRLRENTCSRPPLFYLRFIMAANHPIILAYYLRRRLLDDLQRMDCSTLRGLEDDRGHRLLFARELYCEIWRRGSEYARYGTNYFSIPQSDTIRRRLLAFLVELARNLLEYMLCIPKPVIRAACLTREPRRDRPGECPVRGRGDVTPDDDIIVVRHYIQLHEQLKSAMAWKRDAAWLLFWLTIDVIQELIDDLRELEKEMQEGIESGHGGPLGDGDSGDDGDGDGDDTSSEQRNAMHPKTVEYLFMFAIIDLDDSNKHQLVQLARQFQKHMLTANAN